MSIVIDSMRLRAGAALDDVVCENCGACERCQHLRGDEPPSKAGVGFGTVALAGVGLVWLFTDMLHDMQPPRRRKK